jgi:hypothetical protein
MIVSGCAHSPKGTVTRRFASVTTDPHPSKIVESRETPTSNGCYALDYQGFSTTLNPGEGIEFGVPKELQKKSLTFVVLGHAQMTPYGSWDDKPGLTSLQFRSADDHRWKYWGGPSSGEAGAKFAEYRSGGLELEGLYEWGHYGHLDLETKVADTSPFHIDRIRAVSTGTDQVVVGEVGVLFWPAAAKSTRSFVFSPGTSFGDYSSSEGSSYSLDYSTAWKIGYGSDSKTDSSGAKLENGKILIPLAAGEKLGSVEVACGDAPQTGSEPGGGALTIRVIHADGSSDVWKNAENVPPQGILKSATPICGFAAKTGDAVEVSGSGDTVWVMGARLGFL